MKRYGNLTKDQVQDALHKLRTAFLAAKNNQQVDEILHGLLTRDERIKLGRRIAISKLIAKGMGYDEISDELGVGKTTIIHVLKKIDSHPECFKHILNLEKKIQKQSKQKSKRGIGSSIQFFKKKS